MNEWVVVIMNYGTCGPDPQMEHAQGRYYNRRKNTRKRNWDKH